MERVKQKTQVLLEALVTLESSISLFDKYQKLSINKPTQEQEELALGMRDSMIQRFEYCIDLFWKVTKVYLEDIEKVALDINSPRGILRQAIKAHLL